MQDLPAFGLEDFGGPPLFGILRTDRKTNSAILLYYFILSVRNLGFSWDPARFGIGVHVYSDRTKYCETLPIEGKYQ